MRTRRALGCALIVCSALLAFPVAALAHPGSGIVVDRAGNVYFVRTGQNIVWKLSPNGKVAKLVEDDIVRLPHHLTLGRDGTLYMASDFDGRIWRVGADGKLTEQFNTNRITGSPATFVGSWGDPWTIDASGDVYALAAPGGSAIVRITTAGKVTPVAKNARFGELHFSTMALGPDGSLYLTDGNRVWRIVGDSATPIVARGVELGAGVTADSVGNMYVADYSGRRVVRFSRTGEVTTPRAIARLSLSNPWGVTIAPDGSVYVLDHPQNGVAIWRVSGDRAQRVYSSRELSMYVLGFVFSLLPFLVALQTAKRKSTGVGDWIVWTLFAAILVVGAWWFLHGLFLFSWLRHPILALYAYGAWRSWPRRNAQKAQPA